MESAPLKNVREVFCSANVLPASLCIAMKIAILSISALVVAALLIIYANQMKLVSNVSKVLAAIIRKKHLGLLAINARKKQAQNMAAPGGILREAM